MRTLVFTFRGTWPCRLRTWQMPCFKLERGAGSLFKKLNSTYFLFFLFASLSLFLCLSLSLFPPLSRPLNKTPQSSFAWVAYVSLTRWEVSGSQPTKRSLALTGQGPLQTEESPSAVSRSLDPPAAKGPSTQKSLDLVWTPAPIKKQDVTMCAQNPSPRQTEKGSKPSDVSFFIYILFSKSNIKDSRVL